MENMDPEGGSADAISLMDKYIQSLAPANASSPSPSKKDRERKRKKTAKKDKVLEDVTNTASPARTSLDSTPTKDKLKHMKKKQLHQELVLLTERLNSMEDIQVQYNKDMSSLRKRLDDRTKERDQLKEEKTQLEQKVQSLQQEVNRHVDKKFKALFAASS